MKTSLKFLVVAALLAPAFAFSATSPLVGHWKSTSKEQLALKGTITLDGDGHAELAPEGYPAMEGTWQADKDQLTLTMPPTGSSKMSWKVSKNNLSLTYNNGTKQDFVRDAVSTKPANAILSTGK